MAEPQHVSLKPERFAGDSPPLVQQADQVLPGHPHVVEEDLVEVQVLDPTKRRERPSYHTREISRDHQHADALLLGGFRIGANVGRQHIGVVWTCTLSGR